MYKWITVLIIIIMTNNEWMMMWWWKKVQLPSSCAWRMFQSPPKLFIQANRASDAIYPGMAPAKCVTKAVALIAAIVFFYGVIRSHRSQLSNTQNRKVDSTPLPVPPLKVVDSPDRLLRHERISDTKDIPKIKDQNEKEGMKALPV